MFLRDNGNHSDDTDIVYNDIVINDQRLADEQSDLLCYLIGMLAFGLSVHLTEEQRIIVSRIFNELN